MVALITAILVAAAMTVGVFWYARRRPVCQPFSWGQAMAGSAYVYFLLFLSYGVIPHQWLILAENELGWRADKLAYGPGNILQPIHLGGHFPFDITFRTLSDSVAAVIYIVFLTAQIGIWRMWQNRGKRADKGGQVGKSTYGRPLVKQG